MEAIEKNLSGSQSPNKFIVIKKTANEKLSLAIMNQINNEAQLHKIQHPFIKINHHFTSSLKF